MSSSHSAIRFAATLSHALRGEGVPVGVDRTLAFVRASAELRDVYWAGRLTLVSRPEEIPVYERVLRSLLAAQHATSIPRPQREDRLPAPGGPRADEDSAITQEATAAEVLEHTRFADLSDDEVVQLARAIDRLHRLRPQRRTRRRTRHPPPGQVDLRATARHMARHGGDAVPPRFVRPRRDVQPITFVLDVSGSMAASSRALILAAAAFVRAEPEHEAFAFGTRLTRLTPALRRGTAVEALEAASLLAEDRASGTRIGESLLRLREGHGNSRAIRGAVLVIYSDGLERGSPDLLRDEMRAVALRARSVVWMNPLAESPRYAPLARGMQAALPFIDVLASGHDLSSFTAVVDDAVARTRRR